MRRPGEPAEQDRPVLRAANPFDAFYTRTLATIRADIDRFGAFPIIDAGTWDLEGVFEAGSADAGQQLTYYSRGEAP